MKLPPLSQEFFNENRLLFDAELQIVENKMPDKCEHFIISIGNNLECSNCYAGWVNLAPFIKITNGKMQI
jgi:hypothetical protein